MDKVGKLWRQIKEAAPMPRQLSKRIARLFRNIAQMLNRGISLANAKTPPADLDEARYDLLISYMALQDPFSTAIAGEAMSKTKPLTKKTPRGRLRHSGLCGNRRQGSFGEQPRSPAGHDSLCPFARGEAILGQGAGHRRRSFPSWPCSCSRKAIKRRASLT